MERQTNRALQRRSEAPCTAAAMKKEMGVFCGAYIPFMANLLSPMPLLQLSDTTSCKETICFNPAMANLFWILFAANTAVLLYEMYNRKPLFTSHKKNMILGGVNSTSSAVIWACASMIDDCPQDNPYCLQGRQLFSGLHLLAAGVYFYQASLNK
jgi:hypothetical protein